MTNGGRVCSIVALKMGSGRDMGVDLLTSCAIGVRYMEKEKAIGETWSD